jgi:hypothetical protein
MCCYEFYNHTVDDRERDKQWRCQRASVFAMLLAGRSVGAEPMKLLLLAATRLRPNVRY